MVAQFVRGLNMEIDRAEPFNNTLLHSLSTIQAAKTQFHLLTAGSLTPALLVAQIRLCDVLLGEIRAISCSLERRMKSPGTRCRRSVVARRNRSGRDLAGPPSNPANHSERQR